MADLKGRRNTVGPLLEVQGPVLSCTSPLSFLNPGRGSGGSTMPCTFTGIGLALSGDGGTPLLLTFGRSYLTTP